MQHPLLMDAVMTTRNAACLAEFALSPLFTRQWSSVYEALQDSRPDRKKTDDPVHQAIGAGSPSHRTCIGSNRVNSITFGTPRDRIISSSIVRKACRRKSILTMQILILLNQFWRH
jgi:hypothetical protein